MQRTLLMMLAAGAQLAAHDFWIQPRTFLPKGGEVVTVTLMVGENLIGDPTPRNAAYIEHFFVQVGDERKPLIGREGATPAGWFRADVDVPHVIGYRGKPRVSTQSPGKFAAYLKEEGLDHIAGEWAGKRNSGSAVRELYSRCAKSLLHGAADKVLGFPLELVRESETSFRLLYEGRPLSHALVVALNRAPISPAARHSARTDAEGLVNLPVTAAGMWLVKSVHMRPAAAGANADWESLWASLTFEAPPYSGGHK